jgi:hypothetical protein
MFQRSLLLLLLLLLFAFSAEREEKEDEGIMEGKEDSKEDLAGCLSEVRTEDLFDPLLATCLGDDDDDDDDGDDDDNEEEEEEGAGGNIGVREGGDGVGAC